MRQAVEFVGIVNLVLFATIAVVCVRQWRRERAVTAFWAALAFVSLSWVIAVGSFLPEDPESLAGKVVQRIDIAILVLFPYLLYRFAAAFEPTSRPLARFVDGLSITLVAVTFVLPFLPARGRGVAVVVHRLRRRLPRALVGAADHRRDPPLASGTRRGVGRAQADADARARVDGADRRARLVGGRG